MTRTISTRVLPGLLAVGVVAATVAAVPGTATAAPAATTTTTTTTTTAGATTAPPSNPSCTPALLSEAQQQVEADLSGRVAQLQALQTAADNSANHLSASDRGTLQNDITTVELPGIQALQTQAQQDTTCAALRQTAHAMVFTYRVYMVMTPQTHLTIVADDETYIEGLLSNLESTISSALNDSNANSTNLSAAQNAFGQFQSEVSSAQSSIGGLSAQLLAQTPAEAPGNWEFFVQARTTLTAARNDLHSAYADALEIKTDLS